MDTERICGGVCVGGEDRSRKLSLTAVKVKKKNLDKKSEY